MSQSQFKNKIQDLRLNRYTQVQPTNDKVRHVCSAQVKIRGYCSPSPRTQLTQNQPIIICKKQKKDTKQTKKQIKTTKIQTKIMKKVQPFVPIQIPQSPRTKIDTKFKSLLTTQASTPAPKKQIQIHIQKDSKDKQCLRKLFKKIHKLTEDLAQSEKQRIRLQLQLDNLKNVDGFNRGQQKDLLKSEGENYKLRSDIDYFKELLKDRNNQIAALKNKVPNQIIKQVVVQKPVQVRVEVPKYIPGPQKIIQIPKIIQNKNAQKQAQNLRRRVADLQNQLLFQKSQNQMLRQRPPQRIQKQVIVPQIVEKPVYLQKPIYIDRPVYIEKPIQKQRVIQVPIQIPYQVPVYIDSPKIDEQLYLRIADLERQIQILFTQNSDLKNQNIYYKSLITQLHSNIQILSRHNTQKNHQIQSLLQNAQDYNPIKIKQIIRRETRNEVINQNYRNLQAGATTFGPNI